MNSTIAIVCLIAWGAIVLTLSAFAPWPLSDRNEFLESFVTHEFLSFMGVVVTITLASAGNLHVEMNKLEVAKGRDLFTGSKKDVSDSAYALVGSLIAAVVVVLVKPWIGFGIHGESFMNGAALGVLGFAIMIMIDLLQAAFSLDPRGVDPESKDH